MLITLMLLAIRAVNYPTCANRVRSCLRAHSGGRAQDLVISLGLSLSPHLDAAGDTILETGINATLGPG
jgi:hypothetical protein